MEKKLVNREFPVAGHYIKIDEEFLRNKRIELSMKYKTKEQDITFEISTENAHYSDDFNSGCLIAIFQSLQTDDEVLNEEMRNRKYEEIDRKKYEELKIKFEKCK